MSPALSGEWKKSFKIPVSGRRVWARPAASSPGKYLQANSARDKAFLQPSFPPPMLPSFRGEHTAKPAPKVGKEGGVGGAGEGVV